MKRNWLNLFKKLGLPALAAGTLLTLFSPATALAQSRGDRGRDFDRGRNYSVRRDFDRGRDRDDRGRYYRGGGGASFGFYTAPRVYGPAYSYAPGYCSPAGYYDRWGYWRPYPRCAVYPPPY